MKHQSKLYDLFNQQVSKHKDNIAISSHEGLITYKELEARINSLCNHLAKINHKEFIAIALPPSINFIVAMLACFKLNYTYVPLNISYPSEYLKKLTSDANINYIISNSSCIDKLKELSIKNIVNIDKINHQKITANIVPDSNNELAYIIYTSGTTGNPKGVTIGSDSLYNLIIGTRQLYKITFEDCIPLFHSLNFDVSIWEICAALFNGAQLIIPTENIKKSPADYLNFLLEKNITIANMTPSYFYLMQTVFLNAGNKILNHAKLRLILLAGEAFHPRKIIRWFDLDIAKQAGIFNMYGITEATIHSTYIKITKEMTESDLSMIGIPLPNVDLVRIDSNQKQIHDDTTGEICLSGISLSKGYFNQPELTNKVFFAADFEHKGEKIWFKTGDLAKKNEYGLEYIGRKNQLTKIRGFRVNPAEIENILCTYPEVKGAIVTSYNTSGGHTNLAAFIRSDQNTINLTSIINNLKKVLPEFMCPSKIFLVKEFPLTINGKIDFDKLKDGYINYGIYANEIASAPDTLNKIKNAWKTVLNTEEIELDVNFFDAGGDSLLLIKLQHILQDLLGRKFKILDLIRHSTIEKFEKFISS